MGSNATSIGLGTITSAVALLGVLAITLAVLSKRNTRASAKNLDLSAAPPHVQAKLLEAFDVPTFEDFLTSSIRTYHRTYRLTNRRDFEAERERTGRIATAVFIIACNGSEREAHIHIDEAGIPVGINLPRPVHS
jgi:hypothetical protein